LTTTDADRAHPANFGLRLLAIVAGAATLAGPIFWTLNPFGIARSLFVADQYLAAELGMALCFVAASAARVTEKSWLRLLLTLAAVGGAAVGLMLAVHFGSPEALFVKPTAATLSLAVALIVLTTAALALGGGGLTMVLFVLGTLAFGYLAQFVGGVISTAPIRLERYIVYLVLGGDGFIGQALQVMATSVVVYLLFGAAYEVAGGTAALDALANRLAGRGKGTAIKATVISSALFGLISGSATSNVVTSGAFTIPAMKRQGVSAPMAGGIEAVSSTIGQVTPPVLGAAAFLMADLTGIPYAQIALATALPAFIVYAVMVHQGTWIGSRVQADSGGETIEAAPLPWSSALHLLPVITIFGIMFAGDRLTALAGIAGAVVALAVGVVLHGPRETLRRCRRVARAATGSIANLIVAGSALGVIVGVLSVTGLDVALTLGISHLGEHNLVLALVLTALAAFLLGTGLSTSGVYLVVGTLLAPGLVKLGVPVMSAHLFVLYWAMLSMITPPVAFAALAASSISGATFSATGWASMRFGWIAFVVPFAFVAQPALVLVGTPMQLGLTLAAVAGGVWVGRRIVDPRSRLDLGLALLGTAAALGALLDAGPEPQWPAFVLLALVFGVGLVQSAPRITQRSSPSRPQV
jgi:TRAP transporter 4TM/12TM fusion protein